MVRNNNRHGYKLSFKNLVKEDKHARQLYIIYKFNN
jgi:hypothetical protein